MKVLFITYTGLADDLGMSQIVPYLKQLAEEGVEFKVISFERSDGFQERARAARDLLMGFSVECHFVNKLESRGPVARGMAIARAAFLSCRIARTFKPDLIHCRNAFAAECAMMASRLTGIPYLFDMRGFWGDARRETRHWNPCTLKGRVAFSLWKRRERQYIKRSAITNCLTMKAKEWIVSRGYKRHSEVVVTPCCVEFSADSSAPAPSLGAPGRFTCIYVGSMGGVYDDARIFRTYTTIRSMFPGARLRVLTAKTADEVIATASRSSVQLSPAELEVMRVSHREVFDCIRSADVGLSFCKPGFFASGVSSTKIGEYLSEGLPVISNVGLGDVEGLLRATGGGLALPDACSPDVEAQAVKAFIAQIQGIDRGEIRERARSVLDMSVAVSNYKSAYLAASSSGGF